MIEALTHYADLLRTWNRTINLVSPDTLMNLEQRHVADCLQVAEYLPARGVTLLDLGSGGGLPGLVIAIARPQDTITLVESDTRKGAFLQTVVQTLNLKHVKVCVQRVESLPREPDYEVITARAFAPLPKLLTLSAPLLAPGGCWWLLKGAAVDEELRSCGTLFPMTVQRFPSKVVGEREQPGWILQITPQENFPAG